MDAHQVTLTWRDDTWGSQKSQADRGRNRRADCAGGGQARPIWPCDNEGSPERVQKAYYKSIVFFGHYSNNAYPEHEPIGPSGGRDDGSGHRCSGRQDRCGEHAP